MSYNVCSLTGQVVAVSFDTRKQAAHYIDEEFRAGTVDAMYWQVVPVVAVEQVEALA